LTWIECASTLAWAAPATEAIACATCTRIDVAAVPMLTATGEVDGVVITRDGARITCFRCVGWATKGTEAVPATAHTAAQTLLGSVGALQGALAPVSELAVRRRALGTLALALRRIRRSGFTSHGLF